MTDNTEARCEIRVRGYLDEHWSDCLGDLDITYDDQGNTILSGIVDQAALYGILAQIRDLGLPLLSVNVGEEEQKG